MPDGPNVAQDPADLEVVDVADLGSTHVLGLGGSGMSGIARVLLGHGLPVSGADVKRNRRMDALANHGARVHVGHTLDNLQLDGETVSTVVYSTAIPPDNIELVAARQLGVRVLERSAALASVARGSRTIAIAGTHGKTTTTSMTAVALQSLGLDPSFIIGSEIAETGSNGHRGTGEFFVIEADESDGCFLRLEPEVAIVTNIEADHLNYWGDLAALEQGFEHFVELVKQRQGFAVINVDDPGSRKLAEYGRKHGIDVRTYGMAPEADYRTSLGEHPNGMFTFSVEHAGGRFHEVALSVPGSHNAANATAALAVLDGLGLDAERGSGALATFRGASRRFDFRGEVGGVRVYDDYAHHPTEIAATLRAAREFVGSGRIIAAFQAHHYYRTALFLREFADALGLADYVVVLEVFAPGETPIPGASGQGMAAAVPLPDDHVIFEPSWSRVAQHLAEPAQPGDIVMTLGAGDISLLGPEVLSILQSREAQRTQVSATELTSAEYQQAQGTM